MAACRIIAINILAALLHYRMLTAEKDIRSAPLKNSVNQLEQPVASGSLKGDSCRFKNCNSVGVFAGSKE